MKALLDGKDLPGVRSEAVRGADGMPVRVVLRECGTDRCCIIGRRDTGSMRPDQDALDGEGAAMLRNVRNAPGEWCSVDEIGYLEECSGAYKDELRRLFDDKRVLAAIRKADTPFLCELRARDDCLVLDLDELEETT